MKRLFIGLLVLVLAALPLTAVSAQNGVTGYVNTDLLNLRPSASLNSNPIAQIPGGYSVVLTARTADNQWFGVVYDADGYSPLRGWVSAPYITLTTGNINLLPITDGNSTPTGATYATGFINTGALNIRTVPNPFNNVPAAVLYQGTTLDVIGRTADSEWLQVRYGPQNSIGWARGRYVTLTAGSNVAGLPVASGNVVTQPPVTQLVLHGVIDTGALNIRTVPRWWNNIPITFLYRGTGLDVIGRNSDLTWYQVRLENGTVGWARSKYVAVTGNVYNLPVAG